MSLSVPSQPQRLVLGRSPGRFGASCAGTGARNTRQGPWIRPRSRPAPSCGLGAGCRARPVMGSPLWVPDPLPGRPPLRLWCDEFAFSAALGCRVPTGGLGACAGAWVLPPTSAGWGERFGDLLGAHSTLPLPRSAVGWGEGCQAEAWGTPAAPAPLQGGMVGAVGGTRAQTPSPPSLPAHKSSFLGGCPGPRAGTRRWHPWDSRVALPSSSPLPRVMSPSPPEHPWCWAGGSWAGRV